MWRFFKTWLLLRLLQDDEENYISNNLSSIDENLSRWRQGERPFVGRNHFVSHYSNHTLIKGFIPGFTRKFFWRPLGKECDCVKNPNVKKLRDLDSLINRANNLGYLDTQPLEAKKSDTIFARRIRLSSEGDEFVSYFGGIEMFIKTYKSIWGIVAVSLIPWIITNHHQILSFLRRFI